MIKQIRQDEFGICLDIIHRSFGTVAEEFGLTVENCPGNTAFMKLEQLEREFSWGNPMFLYGKGDDFIGFCSLRQTEKTRCELNHLAVLPAHRHLGAGRKLVEYAKRFASEELRCNTITIGILEENAILKAWYEGLGFVHTGTRKFEHLPFTVGFMELNLQEANL